MENEIINFGLKILAYGGGAVAICFTIVKVIGTKWLDSKFSQRLEEFKRFQNQEYAKFQYQLNKLFNRITKIQEKEFETLPNAWEKLQLAFGALSEMTFPLQSYPDFTKMNGKEIDEVLKHSKLFDYQKEELKTHPNKNDYYVSKIFWVKYSEANNKLNDFHNYIILNKIFFDTELFEKFSEIDKQLMMIHTRCEFLDKETQDYRSRKETRDEIEKIETELKPKIDSVEKIIQKRLRFSDAD